MEMNQEGLAQNQEGGRDHGSRGKSPQGNGQPFAQKKPMKKFVKGGFKRQVCIFCEDSKKEVDIDYKNISFIRRYISDRGKIMPARITGNCALHQRKVKSAIKQARNIALLPYKTIVKIAK